MRTGVRVALALLLASAAAPVLACSCVFPPGARSDHVRREYRDASAVFSAYVHGIHMAEIEGQPVRVARLRVLQVWKGDGVAADSWMDVVADDDTGLVGCGYSANARALPAASTALCLAVSASRRRHRTTPVSG